MWRGFEYAQVAIERLRMTVSWGESLQMTTTYELALADLVEEVRPVPHSLDVALVRSNRLVVAVDGLIEQAMLSATLW